jgi:GntR family transcriptional repressor for pyruvate dehydrogenase complex
VWCSGRCAKLSPLFVLIETARAHHNPSVPVQRTGASRGLLTPYEGEQAPATSGMAIAAQLREAISRDYHDGEMIGSEDDLIVRFGVSRPTMRQAVRVLQAEGLITIRRGLNGGMFARVPSPDSVSRSVSLLLRHRGATMRQLLDAMLPVTDTALRLAAGNPDAAARAQAAERVLAYVPLPGVGRDEQTMQATEYLAQSLDPLVDNPVVTVMAHVMLSLFRVGFGGPPTRRVNCLQIVRAYHCRIAEAVAAGDGDAAAALSTELAERIRAWIP